MKIQEKLEKIPCIEPAKDIDTNLSTVKMNMDTFYKNFKSAFNL
ncbi:MAG: hypothetical protein YK1312THETA_390002 [Marine Group I thaumarchaeote]|nr:MAG: hypothetical protein YK1312THETA_390002 [Marine Group I thaumarchaeote]